MALFTYVSMYFILQMLIIHENALSYITIFIIFHPSSNVTANQTKSLCLIVYRVR